ncbi:MAG: nucleotidyltransferase family protein [Planctomycetia bacterium]|nr:nucleotidyltransferase family protein [Planctomycetia bacterium]
MLLKFLANPESCQTYTLSQWERLFAEARAVELFSRLAGILQAENLEAYVPEQARWLLESARVRAARAQRQMRWELGWIRRAMLAEVSFVAGKKPVSGFPVVLLKGAAYLSAELPWSVGRISVDTDILVPRTFLPDVETRLMVGGWYVGNNSEYDEHFYRDWTHELPPMTHLFRRTNLDVHHTILPPTNRVKVPADKLFESLIPLEKPFFTLSWCDMVLHCVTHCFQDGDLAPNSLKDLADFHAMLPYFTARDADFGEKLAERTAEMNLRRPMFYALRYAQKMLHTPIPDALLRASRRWGSGVVTRCAMDFCVPRSLTVELPGEERIVTRVARTGMLARQHWLRMPLQILIPHLWKKWRKRKSDKKQ